jgi:hypothetical protein
VRLGLGQQVLDRLEDRSVHGGVQSVHHDGVLPVGELG